MQNFNFSLSVAVCSAARRASFQDEYIEWKWPKLRHNCQIRVRARIHKKRTSRHTLHEQRHLVRRSAEMFS